MWRIIKIEIWRYETIKVLKNKTIIIVIIIMNNIVIIKSI